MQRVTKMLACGCCLSVAAVATSPAWGQGTAPSTGSASVSQAELPDIVVTAQRRSENVNKVPIAISVVSGDALKSVNATRLSDIQQFAPSVQFTETPAQQSFQIRGIGTEAYDYSVEQAVGIAVDDVNITLPRVNPFAILADVDRVEVLRGPQGLLFGKNTTAGLISVVTRKPQMGVYSSEGHLQVGSRDQIQVYDIVNVPLGSTLAARVEAGYQTGHSAIRNRGTSQIADQRDYQFKGKLLWEPTDNLSLYAIGNYQSNQGDPGTATVRSYSKAPGTHYGPGTYQVYGAPYFGPAAGGPAFVQRQLTALGIVAGSDNRDTAINVENYVRAENYGGQLSVNYTVGGQTITSVTAYRKENSATNLEVDETPLPVLDRNGTNLNAYQLTQELRIASPTGARLEYVAGLYYYHQRTRATQVQAGTLGLLPSASPVIVAPTSVGGLNSYYVDSKSYAGFGQATYRLTPEFRVLAGARYTRDELDARFNILPLAGVCGTSLIFVGVCNPTALPTARIGDRNKHGDWSGRAGLEYDLDARSMAYLTVSRGYKGAAVSTVSGQVFDVRPETVVSYEAGLKTQLFDRRLGLTLALFRSDFKDFQAEVFDPSLGVGAFRTGNAGKLKTQGVEMEFLARPFRGLSLSGGVTYDDASFGRYAPPCYAGMTAAQGCNLATDTFDASGDRLTNAPKWSGSLNGNYETKLTEAVKGFDSVNWSYHSAVLFGVGDPGTRQEGYGITNVNLGVGDSDEHVRVSVFVRNVFDKRYVAKIFSSLFDTGGYSQILPENAFRRIGAALDWKF